MGLSGFGSVIRVIVCGMVYSQGTQVPTFRTYDTRLWVYQSSSLGNAR